LSKLSPDFTASATLTAETAGGALKFVAPDLTLSVLLAPFFVGPKGEHGDNQAAMSLDDGNQLTLGLDGGLYMGAPALETAYW
jgi:hypothetical protein